MTKKKKIGFTSGAFDLCHAGHLLMFKEVRAQCDYLIVALHSDPSTERFHKNKPVESKEERRIRLESCRYIDKVVDYDTESQCRDLIIKLKPDVRFVGADWKGKHFTGDDLPVKVIFNTRDHGYSSTDLRKRIFLSEFRKKVIKHQI
jgi:glycerol-3-phosphate cytidylyltransferase